MSDSGKQNLTFWQRLLGQLGLDRKDLRAWAYYDVANSSFAAVIMVAILPIYFADVVATDLQPAERTSMWAYISAVAMIITAVVSPFLGTICDAISGKKKFLLALTITGSLSSAALAFAGKGLVTYTSLMYIIANISFALGNVFYEALLVDICDEDNVHTTSTSAYAVGYLASGVLLAINLAWVMMPETFGFSDGEQAVKASFITVGLWWAVFSIPLFKHVKEKKYHQAQTIKSTDILALIAQSGSHLLQTFREVKSLPNLFIFLVAFWFYSDGIGTIMKLATIYGKEVGIGNNDLMAAIVLVQFVGVPSSFIFGPLAMKIGAKRGLYITLYVYLSLTILAYFMTSAIHFWILAMGVALVQGASQALSRSIYALLVPESRAGEFFGFYSVSSKFAGIFGPLIFGFVSSVTGGSRLSIAFICLLFVVGIWLLRYVDIEKGKQEAASYSR